MLVDEISTKVKRWAIILTVEPVGFLARMGYKESRKVIPYFSSYSVHKGELSCIFVNEMSNVKVHIFNKY